MAGGKETPRQKMVGMMYLVLTALLALNVSKEIIRAFITINDKIETGNVIIQRKNVKLLYDYDAKIVTAQAQKALDLVKSLEAQRAVAFEIDSKTREASNFIITEASEMIKLSEGQDWYEEDEEMETFGDNATKWLKLKSLHEIKGMDNYDIPTQYYVGDVSNPTGKGVDILEKLIELRDYLTETAATHEHEGKSYTFKSPGIRAANLEDKDNPESEYNKALDAALESVKEEDRPKIKQIYNILSPVEKVQNHGQEVQWIVAQFDHAPIVAAAALLTSLRSDCLQAESIALELLGGRAEAPIFKFNKIEPLAFARTGYINQGDSLGVKVYIAAYDSTEVPKVRFWLNDSSYNEATAQTVTGQAMIKNAPVGTHTVYGQISVKERGQETWKKWKFPFEVGKPSGSIGMPEMLTLYRNYPNQISASASGYPTNALSLGCNGCNLTKQGDIWIATPGPGKEATMTLTAKKEGGGSASLATASFKIRSFPTPNMLLGGKPPGSPLSKSAISANRNLILNLGDSPLKASFTVNSFEIIVGNKIIKCSGAALSGDALGALSTAPAGTAILIRNVVFSGPSSGVSPSGGWTIQ
jgi:gliding motility-associated protein GldM